MMRRLLKTAAILCALGCMLAVTALAQEPANFSRVTTADELITVMLEVNSRADAANQKKVSMDPYTIELGNDIVLNDVSGDVMANLSLRAGGDLCVRSAPGKRCVITAEQPGTALACFDVEYNGKLTFENVVFDGAKDPAFSMGTVAGELTLRSCEIRHFKAEDVLEIKGRKVGYDTHYAECTMEDVNMHNNHATGRYAAVQLDLLSYAHVRRCTFADNKGSEFGSALFINCVEGEIEDCVFTNNTANAGGAAFARHGIFTLRRCRFEGNSAKTSDGVGTGNGGGGIGIGNDCEMLLEDCVFVDNYSDLSGGAIQAFENCVLTLRGCTMRSNVADTHGGAMCVAESFRLPNAKTLVTMTDCLLENNRANSLYSSATPPGWAQRPGGGAIFQHERTSVTLGSGVVVRNNSAAYHGGGVYLAFGSRMTLDGAVIENNATDLDGGGVYVGGVGMFTGKPYEPEEDDPYNSSAILTILDGRISGNRAKGSGGGVCVSGTNYYVRDNVTYRHTGGTLLMKGGVITGNTAVTAGGGVCVRGAPDGDRAGMMTMTDGLVCMNTAGAAGNTDPAAQGADVYCEGGNAVISLTSAQAANAYAQDGRHALIPAGLRAVQYTDWYYDHGAQAAAQQRTRSTTAADRYHASAADRRTVYRPVEQDKAQNALILGYADRPQPHTGDDTPLWLYLTLLTTSLAAAATLLRRSAAGRS